MSTFSLSQTRFETAQLDFSQQEMQAYLQEVYQKNLDNNLNPVLDKLYEWSYQVGYLTDAKLYDNQHFDYFSPDYQITFKTQINIARSNYTPKPLSGLNIPKLHCPICIENVGIPGKEDLRVFEFELQPHRNFFIQLTPFPLFPYHFVLISKAPTPMIMSGQSIQDLADFIQKAPGFVGCSNSDVEWAGASVLVHHHYQVIRDLKLPIMEARMIPELSHQEPSLKLGLLHFPIACCKLESLDLAILIKAGGKIIHAWKKEDPGRNTCNLILKQDPISLIWQLFIIFRNPDFRTPATLTSIKSEGVGIIEVAGEGIYPVPKGEHATQTWDRIEHEGLEIILGIIAGNNPVNKDQYPDLFQRLLTPLFSDSQTQEPQVILIDDNDLPVGFVGKQEAHLKGLLHRAFSIFVFRKNSDGVLELLLQQRAAHKYHCAGLWTNTCCSHPAPHEDTLAAAHRRLKEELGLSLPLSPAGSFIYRAEFTNGLIEHELDHVFVGYLDDQKIQKIAINPLEIQATRWISLDDSRKWQTDKPEEFTPWFNQALKLAILACDRGELRS